MKVTYHKQHRYTDPEGKQVELNTQLYKIGVYGIINADPALQFNLEPSQLAELEEKLIKDEESGEIKDLELNYEVTVDDSTGFWKVA